jgi:multiple sugar transport system permease protein
MANVDRVAGVERARGRDAGVLRPALPLSRKILGWDHPALWLAPLVLILLFIGIYPFLYNIFNSFREFDPMTGDVEPVGWANWSQLLRDGRVRGALQITAQYVAVALAIEFVLGLAIAVLLNAGPRLAGLWQSMMILPLVVPPTIAALMFGLLENSEYGTISWIAEGLGLVSDAEPLIGGTGEHALWGVLLPEIWQWTPFFVLILLAGLKALPTEPLEAAEVDGAGRWQKFWDITLPMLRPMIAVAVLFRLVDLLKVFDYVFVMTSGGPGTRTEVLSFYAYQQSFAYIKWGYGSVLGLVILALAILLANVYLRVFKVEW